MEPWCTLLPPCILLKNKELLRLVAPVAPVAPIVLTDRKTNRLLPVQVLNLIRLTFMFITLSFTTITLSFMLITLSLMKEGWGYLSTMAPSARTVAWLWGTSASESCFISVMTLRLLSVRGPTPRV